MFLQPLDLTTALRPALFPDETLLSVQDHIGIYEGNSKVPYLQNGSAYLTTHRVCYIDDAEPRKNSAAIYLKNVEKHEFYAGFLKSSAKITLYPKGAQKPVSHNASGLATSPPRSLTSSPALRDKFRESGRDSPQDVREATWVCPICTFVNPVPSNFDPATANNYTPIPPCLACGIKPPFSHVLKAAIASATGRKGLSSPNIAIAQAPNLSAQQEWIHARGVGDNPEHSRFEVQGDPSYLPSTFSNECPRCTFVNHPSMRACEVCRLSLMPQDSTSVIASSSGSSQPRSPGQNLENRNEFQDEAKEHIKLSFRAGGDKIFYERLKGAMTQRKWLLQSAPPIPAPYMGSPSLEHGPYQNSAAAVQGSQGISAGIAGLERRGLELRQKNEAVIGSAFSDLDALRASAKEIIALAESFASQSTNSTSSLSGTNDASQLIAESAHALDMVTTKDIAGTSRRNRRDNSLYFSEVSRNLAEYLTDDTRGVLNREGGIMSLVDLWALYNRARSEGGVDLISPEEFEKAAQLWEKLRLPVRLRHFRNGLMVVQQADRTDDKTVAQLLNWLQELHVEPLAQLDADGAVEAAWDRKKFGRGVTVQETAQHFGWSVGVAKEELEMAEEKGALCRDGESAAGAVTFWENWITELLEDDEEDENDAGQYQGSGYRKSPEDDEALLHNLRATGLM